MVELRGAWLEWCVGVGPSRKRVAPSVDHCNGLHPFGARTRTPRNASSVEPVVVGIHI